MALAAFFEVTQEHVDNGLYTAEQIGRRVYKETGEMETLLTYIKRKEAYDRAQTLTIARYNKMAQELIAKDPDLNKDFEDTQYEEELRRKDGEDN